MYKFYPETIEELYTYINDELILSYYFGDFEDQGWYISPFRENETNPSFLITYYNDKWVWRDFGIDKRPKSGLNFVQEKFKLSIREAIIKITNDLIGNDKKIKTNILYTNKRKPKVIKKNVGIKIWKPKFDITLEYWNKYNISKKEFDIYNIYEGQLWTNNRILYNSNKYKAFSIYLFNKLDKIWKAYNHYPKAKQLRFYANNVIDHIQNYNNLGKFNTTANDILFVTKSYKCCIVLNKLGYDAVAPHCESLFLAPWELDYLNTIYRYIIILYDNDETGIKKSNMFLNEFNTNNNLYSMLIPEGLTYHDPILNIAKKAKDTSDVVDGYNYQTMNNIILDFLNEINI